MSKAISEFFTKLSRNFNMKAKFQASHSAGNRIVPSQTSKNDADYQMRIDAGEMAGTYRNVVLQVNTQAKGTALKEWVRKHGSHAKLATARFDTAAEDPDAEADRVLKELEEEAKNNI